MKYNLRMAEGRTVYRRRKAIVGPVFGQIKEARGFRGFLLRGLGKESVE
jgi:Transposase DDE domain